MATIGLAPHAERAEALDIAKATAIWLEQEGHTAVIFQDGLPPKAGPAILDSLDLMVSLGGDGTLLRAAALVVGSDVPVLGVNFGRFGYLTAAEPDGLQAAVRRFLAGDRVLERRMTLDASVLGPKAPRLRATALNDVVLARPSGVHTVHVRVAIGGRQFLSYAVDAVIVATATGSTGYNFSARGPIVSPKLRCLVITPVSPHMLFDRSLVLDGSDEVALRVEGRSDAELAVDGEGCGKVAVGEKVVCRAGAHDVLLVSFGERSFESVLKSKFRLSDR
jgi:NAD+ kinase